MYISILIFSIGFISGITLLFLYALMRKKQLSYTKSQVRDLYKKATKEIEHKRKHSLLELKEELRNKRNESDLDSRKRRFDLERLESKFQKKSDDIEHQERVINQTLKELHTKQRDLAKRIDMIGIDEVRIKKVHETLVQKLENLSGVRREEAKRILMESLQEEVKLDNQKWIAKVEGEARITAKEKATRVLSICMQRYMVEQITIHSSSVIQLPNEEMKGRIIGKEGRNIKALEMSTGMEFVIGDTPEIITISGFNPIRREIAKRAIYKLTNDGRINPTRIEETVEKCEAEINSNIEEIGQQAILEFGFQGVHEEIIKLLGMLHFRTSFTQNNLVHSKEVAYFARMIAAELGLNEQCAARCGLLHDIGKAVSAEIEGPHAIIGGDLAKKYGENPIIVNAIAAHHEEVAPTSIYSLVTHIADAISAARPGARRETLSTYIKRLEQLEEISQSFTGVKKAYALQAGREIRVIVDETTLDDESSIVLARDLAKRIADEMNFPGQIKVNVIREKRAIEYAR